MTAASNDAGPTIGARPHLELQTGHCGPVAAVTFSPDGATIASGSYDSAVILWDASTGSMLRRLQGHTWSVIAVAFSGDGNALASADPWTTRLWDPASG